jgi:hypothetical protein
LDFLSFPLLNTTIMILKCQNLGCPSFLKTLSRI